jgi:hypothetical protein
VLILWMAPVIGPRLGEACTGPDPASCSSQPVGAKGRSILSSVHLEGFGDLNHLISLVLFSKKSELKSYIFMLAHSV